VTNGGYIRDEELSSYDCREQYSRDWGVSFPWVKTWNEAMLLWLSHIKVERPEEPLDVPVMYQTPARAFAEITMPTVNDQIALPIITFTLSGQNYDANRNWGGYFFPNFGRSRTADGWQIQRKPMPWELTYVVTIWTKYQIDMDIIMYRLLSRFTPDSYITAYGIAARTQLTNHTNTSDLEPGEATDRMIRNDLSLKVDAWMVLPELQVGQIEGVDIILDNDKSTDIDVNFDLSQDINIVEGDFDLDGSIAAREPQSPQVITTEEE
jgi:hypothetical protein